VAGLDCKDTLKQLESVVATEEEVDSYFCGGEFLPLAVWATRGFNTEAIQAKSLKDDIKEDRVLGTVYRVRIIRTGFEHRRSVAKSSTQQATLTPKPVTDPITGSSRLAIEDGTAHGSNSSDNNDDDDSQSSASDDSSSSSHKKSKKKSRKSKKSKRSSHGKKSKKDRKETKDKNKKDKKRRGEASDETNPSVT
jgi:hypothetical protein